MVKHELGMAYSAREMQWEMWCVNCGKRGASDLSPNVARDRVNELPCEGEEQILIF